MIIVKEVKSKRELKKFVKFPNIMYKHCEQYVPAFYGDDLSDWGAKNPARAYCESKAFLAYDGKKIVGRIGAIISHRANEKWGTKRMRFSQVDFIDDLEVSKALFKAVEDYAKENGCEEIHGPLGFSDLDREGMLIEGFDQKSLFYTYYNYPYYNTHLKLLGFEKDVDWIENRIKLPEDPKEFEYFEKISQYVLDKFNLHLADLRSKKDYARYVPQIFSLVNTCYGHLYGTVDLNTAQINRYTRKFSPLVDPDFACFILDSNDRVVGFCVSALSVERAIKKSNGRLFPRGWFGVLRALHKNDLLDMLLVAVLPEYQGLGVNSVFINHSLKGAKKRGVKYAETGPQLELNEKVRSQWNRFNSETHKKRRCYIKKVD